MVKLSKLLLLSLPLFFLSEGCQEPNYYKGCAMLYVERPVFYIVKDFDKDKRADGIINEKGVAKFYAEGYEGKLSITDESRQMNSKLREVASNFIDDENMYHFIMGEFNKEKNGGYDEIQKKLSASNYKRSSERLKKELDKFENKKVKNK